MNSPTVSIRSGGGGIGDGDEPAPKQTVDAVYVDALVGEVVLGAVREAVRNAAAHGRGDKADQPLSLQIRWCTEFGAGGERILTIADNGVGLNAGGSRAASAGGGSGNGVALHRTLLAMVGGYLSVESSAEGGTQVKIAIPVA